MSKTILLKRATEMLTPYRGRGKVSLMHTFPEGTPVLYTRSELTDGVVHHKIHIRWEGELYERHLSRRPADVPSPTGRSPSEPNPQSIAPRTEESDKLREAARRYHGATHHESIKWGRE